GELGWYGDVDHRRRRTAAALAPGPPELRDREIRPHQQRGVLLRALHALRLVGPAAVHRHGVPGELRPNRLGLRALLDDADPELELTVLRACDPADGEAHQLHGYLTAVRPLLLGDRQRGAERRERHAAYHAHPPRAAVVRELHAHDPLGMPRGDDQLLDVWIGRLDLRPQLGQLHARLLRGGRQRRRGV